MEVDNPMFQVPIESKRTRNGVVNDVAHAKQKQIATDKSNIKTFVLANRLARLLQC